METFKSYIPTAIMLLLVVLSPWIIGFLFNGLVDLRWSGIDTWKEESRYAAFMISVFLSVLVLFALVNV